MPHTSLAALCQRYQAQLRAVDDNAIYIVVADEPQPELLNALRFATDKTINIERYAGEKLQQPTSDMASPGESATAVDLVNQALLQALQRRASDIHIEPVDEQNCRIRLRIDGVLHPLPAVTAGIAQAVTARLKVLGKLDIAERRLPQDGQFSIELAGQRISFRIATLPCRGGEKVVLRLLQQGNQALAIDALGMTAEQQTLFEQALARPQGLILVTGPTGSGKTITLYSALAALNKPQVNLCSVEDPIEIPLPGLNQTQINARAGLSFQSVLRALLRQDPDIIMVGEIRDGETAEIAIKAAQTGHLVLSTLHTNSPAETLTRLEQMGVARWMLASALELIVAQRLVRRLCPHCRRRAPEAIRLPDNIWPQPLPHWQAEGCEHCYAGFYGRVALFELLAPDNNLRQAINTGMPAGEIEAMTRMQGAASLFTHGCRAVDAGLTTLSELYRVLGIPDG